MAKKIVVGPDQKPSPEKLLEMYEKLIEMYEKLDSQMKEIRKQIRRGVLSSRHVQDLIEHRNPFEKKANGITRQSLETETKVNLIPWEVVKQWANSNGLVVESNSVLDPHDTRVCGRRVESRLAESGFLGIIRKFMCPSVMKRYVCGVDHKHLNIEVTDTRKLELVKRLAQQLAEFCGKQYSLEICEGRYGDDGYQRCPNGGMHESDPDY